MGLALGCRQAWLLDLVGDSDFEFVISDLTFVIWFCSQMLIWNPWVIAGVQLLLCPGRFLDLGVV